MKHAKTQKEMVEEQVRETVSLMKDSAWNIGPGQVQLVEDPDVVEGVIAEALSLYRQKNRDYSDAWRRQGWAGNVARVLSKAARLKNMLWRDQPQMGTEETVEDTLLDMINLCAFTIINIRENNRWGK